MSDEDALEIANILDGADALLGGGTTFGRASEAIRALIRRVDDMRREISALRVLSDRGGQ